MSMMYVAAAVAAVVGGLSANASARAQQAQMRANQNAADYNAQVQRDQAAAALSSANQNEETQRRITALARGRRLAAIGETGMGYSGSNAAVSEQGDIFAELDALNVRYRGQLEAAGLGNQSRLSEYGARVSGSIADTAGRNIWMNTAAGALSSGSSAYGIFVKGT